MRSFAPLLLAAASAGLVSAQSSKDTPCQIAAKAIKDVSKDFTYIKAKVAYDCLTSVPVDQRGDAQLIEDLKLMLSWESDLKYFADAPKSYDLGPLDIIAELNKIKAGLPNAKSEYQVQLDIKALFDKTGNYHLNWNPDILTAAFYFQRSYSITSVSTDGKELPKVYITEDLQVRKKMGDKIKISPIAKINNKPVIDYLNNLSLKEQYLDADARFNKMLWLADDVNSLGSFYDGNVYDGPETQLTFENGTEIKSPNWAFIKRGLDFTGVKDGKTFFDKFCKGPEFLREVLPGTQTTSMAAGRPTTRPTSTSTSTVDDEIEKRLTKRNVIPSSYPTPVVLHSANAVGGYFVDDVAVLRIPTFSPEGEDGEGTEFQRNIRDFLATATSKGKRKLIVDLRENGGGSTHLLLDAFMQIFPSLVPFSAQRYRATKYFHDIGMFVDEIANDPKLVSIVNNSVEDFDFESGFRFWAYWNFVNEQGKNFASWKDFYGPHAFNGDLFTTNFRYNMSNSNRVSILASGFNFTNQPRPQPFLTNDIVMLTDGLCGSACASFHEEMKNIGGVKSIVVGGRPKEGAMQTVGGTKGGEVIDFLQIIQTAILTLNITDEVGVMALKSANDREDLTQLANVSQPLLRSSWSQDRPTSRINTQDQLRKGDKTGTPLQFIYEAADCKMYYTAESLLNPIEIWRQTAKAAWGDKSNCIKGSTNDPSSISGGFKIAGNATVSAANSWKSVPSVAFVAAALVSVILV